MNIYSKRIIVCGTGRYQEDFEYLFDNLNIVGYLGEEKDINTYNGKQYLNINTAKKEDFYKKIVVICERKNKILCKKIYNNFKKFAMVEKKNYVWLEDLGYLLNDKLDKFVADILFWYKYNILGWKNYKNPYVTNEQLFKNMIYTDSVSGPICQYPFKYIHIQPDGYVYSCCPSYAYNIIGNLFVRSVKHIWNCNFIKLHRLSMINKTYAFCDKDCCPYLNSNLKKTNTRFKLEDFENNEYPKHIYVGIDKSCNLCCRSCRKQFYNAKGIKLKMVEYLSKKIEKSNILINCDEVCLASQGEVCFSKVYKNMLFNSNMTKRNNIALLTNGTLLNKEMIDKICDIYKNVKIFLTIDAASEETYKKIRKGGNFKKLMENLQYLSVLRNEGKIERIELNCVIQRENYKEILDIYRLCKELGFDVLNFNKLNNWGTYTEDEYQNASMFDDNDYPKEELMKILKKPGLKKYTSENSVVYKYLK